MALLYIVGTEACFRSLESNLWDPFTVRVTLEGNMCKTDTDIRVIDRKHYMHHRGQTVVPQARHYGGYTV
jgi:hypothetical protein